MSTNSTESDVEMTTIKNDNPIPDSTSSSTGTESKDPSGSSGPSGPSGSSGPSESSGPSGSSGSSGSTDLENVDPFDPSEHTPLDDSLVQNEPLEITDTDDPSTFKHDNSLFMFHTSILSRLAYLDEAMFLTLWKLIYSPDCIDPSFLTNYKDKPLLSEDSDIFGTNAPPDTSFIPQTNTIDFMKWAKKVNIKLTETAFTEGKGTDSSQNCNLPPVNLSENVIMVSIATSNYSTVYVVSDKRNPELTYVIFRGAADGKSASSYNRPSSITPTTVDEDGYLYGIFKILMDHIHEIMSAIKWVRNKVGKDIPWRLVTTGHSLGGALASIFAYLYAKSIHHIKENLTDEPITDNTDITFTEPTDPITCVVFGTPRVFSKETANKFCQFVSENKIEYRRIVTANDPLPGLPFRKFGYRHPCSDDPDMQNKIYVQCDKKIKKYSLTRCNRPSGIEFNYDTPMNCGLGKQTRKFKSVGTLLTDHMEYLGIGYSSAINLKKTLFNEIKKQFDSTSMRIGYYDTSLKFAFVTLDKQRDNKKGMFGLKKTTSEDVRNTYAFMVNLEKNAESFGNESPLSGTKYYYNQHKGEELRFNTKKGGRKRKTRKNKSTLKTIRKSTTFNISI